jgi:hypothetical protein
MSKLQWNKEYTLHIVASRWVLIIRMHGSMNIKYKRLRTQCALILCHSVFPVLRHSALLCRELCQPASQCAPGLNVRSSLRYFSLITLLTSPPHHSQRKPYILSNLDLFYLKNHQYREMKIRWICIYRCAQYPRVIRSKTYRGYVKRRIIPNAIYNVIFV